MRIELVYKSALKDGRSGRLVKTLEGSAASGIRHIDIVDVFIVSGVPEFDETHARDVFADPVAQHVFVESPAGASAEYAGWDLLVEISYRPGVTDTVALTAREAIEIGLGRPLPEGAFVQTARQYLFHASGLTDEDHGRIVKKLHNPLIERSFTLTGSEWAAGKRAPAEYPHTVAPSPVAVEEIELAGLSDDELQELSKRRLLALTLPEMKAVQRYFTDPEVRMQRREAGLPDRATDVELEMIAQTWSEHCKHKIFSAEITYRDGTTGEEERISSLFKEYIRGTTEEVAKRRDFLRSVFHDNAGVVRFDDRHLLCFKVETHNSPSALDPYGGAITGIVGVNRDIIGTGKGAKPIFNTNVLCFGMPDTPEQEIPEGLLHPKQVLAGVHKGIVDGGNQSGIPVVAGGFLFDESFTGKPLVFCGTGGILPAELHGEPSCVKHTRPGDLAVMVGGRIGKDGIHGATFSSLALDETSPTSAVQIGDPITQKKMLDFLLEARDQGLYDGITDNGAGGLSSSLGEMAQSSGGVKIELERCPLKYQGLAPWEILVSESQERMSLSVPPEDIEALLALAARRDVEATVIGEFTGDGFVEIGYAGKPVGRLSLEFLHGGLPQMRLRAEWSPPVRRELTVRPEGSDRRGLTGVLLSLLSEPNIASKERLIRQYDHEVQAQSVIKPFTGPGRDGPTDGAVLKPVADSVMGVTVTHGICPRYSEIDAYHMAMCALDEAYRAHIALGGDPDRASALDNFCWPDPVESAETPDGAYKLAQLVRACKGLKDACIAYGVPLISGKDSMKNDARIGGKKVSVKPTLLVSLMGVVPDIAKSLTTEFMTAGSYIYIAGETRRELAGGFYEKVTGTVWTEVPKVFPDRALPVYRALHEAITAGLVESCHDLSDGGLAVALAESAFSGRLGAEVSLDGLPGEETDRFESECLLFSESPSRFIVTVSAGNAGQFERTTAGLPVKRIGTVNGSGRLTVRRGAETVLEATVEELAAAWKGSAVW